VILDYAGGDPAASAAQLRLVVPGDVHGGRSVGDVVAIRQKVNPLARVSKTVARVTVPWVRIHPLRQLVCCFWGRILLSELP
jgi:hypothetical protein